MIHVENANVLTDPTVEKFQIPVTAVAWGQYGPGLKRFVPVRRAAAPVPLSSGQYPLTPALPNQPTGWTRPLYLSFRMAGTLDCVPWGIYISYNEMDQFASHLCSRGFSPSDALRIAYELAKEHGKVRFELDFHLLNLQDFLETRVDNLSFNERADANFIFSHIICDGGYDRPVAAVRLLEKLHRQQHRAGVEFFSEELGLPETYDITDRERLESKLFEQYEDTAMRYPTSNRIFKRHPLKQEDRDFLRTLRTKSRFKKSPAGGPIPVHMTY